MHYIIRGLLVVCALITNLAISSQGLTQTFGDIEISKNWIRATPPAAKAGGGYLVIENTGPSEDTLIDAYFEGARKTEIHEMKMENNIMMMRPLENGIPIPAGGSVTLKPGGKHLMLMGLKEQLNDGNFETIKLVFSNAGEITVKFPVLDFVKGRKLMADGE